ncbi:MAG: hypothetical protein K6C11_01720 [Bacilli bacterium]|nr:hypothetical protein [Bacilli bacterium]
MKKRNLLFVAVLVLLLAVGFATVSTSLIIGNNTTIGTNPDEFDVYFATATTDEGSTAVISQDKKSITFTTRTLSEVEDFVEVDFDVFNASANYDAVVSLDINVNGVVDNVDYSDYFTVSSMGIGTTLTDLTALSYQYGYVRVTLDQPVLEDIQVTFTATLNVTAVERVELAVQRPQYMEIISGDGKTVGNEISLYNEHFYLLSKEGTTLNYVSKYLLNVGPNAISGQQGIQNVNCTGNKYDQNGCNLSGNTFYYMNGNNFDEKYTHGSSSKPYYVYDENHVAYQYVQNYVEYLIPRTNIEMTGRLINYDDIATYENGVVLNGGKGVVNLPSWLNINNAYFSLGIAGANYGSDSEVWSVRGSELRADDWGSGVKPVISFDESVIDNLEV